MMPHLQHRRRQAIAPQSEQLRLRLFFRVAGQQQAVFPVVDTDHARVVIAGLFTRFRRLQHFELQPLLAPALTGDAGQVPLPAHRAAYRSPWKRPSHRRQATGMIEMIMADNDLFQFNSPPVQHWQNMPFGGAAARPTIAGIVQYSLAVSLNDHRQAVPDIEHIDSPAVSRLFFPPQHTAYRYRRQPRCITPPPMKAPTDDDEPPRRAGQQRGSPDRRRRS